MTFSLVYCIELDWLLCFISAIELQEEGKNAIESPTSPTSANVGPEGYFLGKLLDVHVYYCLLQVTTVVPL